MNRRARVRLDGVDVGTLRESDDGYEFRYLDAWLARPDAKPVSLTLPLRREPWLTKRSLHPYFENLLPEGWLLDLTTTKMKIAKDDAFGILLATASDCIGAVEIIADRDEVTS
jgi:serine/threonine-protein kinase HipA